MGTFYLYLIRDRLAFVLFKLGFASLDIKSTDYKYISIPDEYRLTANVPTTAVVSNSLSAQRQP